jgi:hypothetical protein
MKRREIEQDIILNHIYRIALTHNMYSSTAASITIHRYRSKFVDLDKMATTSSHFQDELM